MSVVSAETLGVPEIFNAASHFVDRNVSEGRGGNVAIVCGEASVTYDEVQQHVNRCGSALRGIGVRPEDRVLLLLYDGPDFVYAFFGAIKIGAVPVPLNTLWKPADYEYVVRDSRAAALIVSAELLPQIERIADVDRRSLRHLIVVGGRADVEAHQSFADLLAQGSTDLEAEETNRDAPALWLYSSGSTGAPKGCVHLQHDLVVCAEQFGKGVLGIRETDRCFSVAKLFFAYGLGNALYFPFSVGATTILWPGAPTAPHVYSTIERHKPTLFYSVPTGYGMMLACGRRVSRFRSVLDSAGGLGGRGAARGALPIGSRSGSASTSSTASGRPRRCTCSSRIVRTRSVQDQRPDRARLRRAAARRRGRPRACRARSATSGFAATRSAPATGISTRRPRTPSKVTGSAPATSTRRTWTGSTGTRAAATTCSKSAASG